MMAGIFCTDYRASFSQALVVVCVLIGYFCVYSAASAQQYPDHPVKIIVPYPAGGTADASARLVGEALARKWKQPVLIENRAGASGNLGADLVMRAEPDGYTLLSSPQSPLVINRHLFPNMRFNPTTFEPVALLVRLANALIVSPSVMVKSIDDLIDVAKLDPDKFTIATQGIGSSGHLTSELFQNMAGVKLRNVHYRGSTPALQDLIAGNVDLMFDNLGTALPLVEGNKLNLLVVTSLQRIAWLPNVPSLAETLPGFESSTWNALVAPPKTPKVIVDQINADVNGILHLPEIISAFQKMSGEVMGGTANDAASYMRMESDRWLAVIKKSGITLQ